MAVLDERPHPVHVECGTRQVVRLVGQSQVGLHAFLCGGLPLFEAFDQREVTGGVCGHRRVGVGREGEYGVGLPRCLGNPSALLEVTAPCRDARSDAWQHRCGVMGEGQASPRQDAPDGVHRGFGCVELSHVEVAARQREVADASGVVVADRLRVRRELGDFRRIAGQAVDRGRCRPQQTPRADVGRIEAHLGPIGQLEVLEATEHHRHVAQARHAGRPTGGIVGTVARREPRVLSIELGVATDHRTVFPPTRD